MKRISIFLCAVIFLLSLACFAEEETYKNQIERLIQETKSLSSYLQANSVDFTSYDKWYAQFKQISDSFKKDFLRSHKKIKSFQTMKEGLDGLASAWGILKQVQYSEVQYLDYITTGNTADAFKWKNDALDKRNKAYDTITQAIESMERSGAEAENE